MSKDRIPADYFSRIKNQEILNAANISLFESKLRLFFLSCMLIFLMTSLAFKMQMQKIEIEKNISKEGERSVQIVHGSDVWL